MPRVLSWLMIPIKMKSYRIIVSGIVQGVFFRYSAKKTAAQLGLKGFARNMDNGDVEIVIEGSDPPVRNFIEWCRKGPTGAHVDSVNTEELEAKGNFDTFEIRY